MAVVKLSADAAAFLLLGLNQSAPHARERAFRQFALRDFLHKGEDQRGFVIAILQERDIQISPDLIAIFCNVALFQ
jgi:hypothetical protein